jgi:hydroxymethylglutaryl-CoA lyase
VPLCWPSVQHDEGTPVRLPQAVTVVEVGPRDGLQNEPALAATATKVALIDRLAAAGLPVIEAGSFVSAARVPQMADTAAVLAGIARRSGTRYPVLVPNSEGFRRATAAGADEVAVFAAASETFSRRNLNCSIAQSLQRYAEVCAAAKTAGVPVRGYVSCVLGCPYEGEVTPTAVADVAHALHGMGCFEISLGDTIGTGTAGRACAMIAAVAARLPLEAIAVHFHDTYGQALANILACLERGIAIVDASVAGLGGCPFAPGAAGNVATEDVVYMLDGLGVRTGVDLAAVADAGRFICAALGRKPASKAAQALAARCAA